MLIKFQQVELKNTVFFQFLWHLIKVIAVNRFWIMGLQKNDCINKQFYENYFWNVITYILAKTVPFIIV